MDFSENIDRRKFRNVPLSLESQIKSQIVGERYATEKNILNYG